MGKREIDRLIAEKVMNWEYYQDGESWITEFGSLFFSDDDDNEWAPSTNINDAWLVFEWIKENVGGIDLITQCTDKPYLMDVWDGKKSIKAEANTAPMAICLAALRSVGIDVPDCKLMEGQEK